VNCRVGPPGPPGKPGTPGTSGGGSFVPFASGLPVRLSTAGTGLEQVALLGFGSARGNMPKIGNTVDLRAGPDLNTNMAFTLATDRELRAISGSFCTVDSTQFIDTAVTVNADLYEATPDDTIFRIVPGSNVQLLPSLTGPVAAGRCISGRQDGLRVPLRARFKYMLVFSLKAVGRTLDQSIDGFAGGGTDLS